MKTNILKTRRDTDLSSDSNNNRDISKNILMALQDGAEIQFIDTEICSEWEYANRHEDEMGNLEDLCKSIQNNGQLQPGLVVPVSNIFKPTKPNKKIKYIIIAGRRRFKACKLANKKYSAVIKLECDIEKALEIQRIENSERKDVSEYSEGMSIYNAIKDKKTTFSEIVNKSSMSKSAIGRLLSYGNLKDKYPDLFGAIASFIKVSSTTASEIYALAEKGYELDLIKYAQKIRQGIGRRTLNNLINESEIIKIIQHKGEKLIVLNQDRMKFNQKLINKPIVDILDEIHELIKPYLTNDISQS